MSCVLSLRDKKNCPYLERLQVKLRRVELSNGEKDVSPSVIKAEQYFGVFIKFCAGAWSKMTF